MSALVTLICDQQLPDSAGDLCGSRISPLCATPAQARELAARDGWTVNAAGDACPGCSSRKPRPTLREPKWVKAVPRHP